MTQRTRPEIPKAFPLLSSSRRFRCAAFSLLLLLLPVLVLPAQPDSLLRHLKFLASDELRGRGNDQPELTVAADYLALEFEKLGLLPAGVGGSFFQPFEVPTGIEVGPDGGVAFFAMTSPASRLIQGRDYIPLTFGESGVVTAPLVFVGFGITAPENHYDDYAHVDVRGKIVVMWEHEPQEAWEGSPFAGRELTPHATVMTKVLNAKHRGAAGVVLIPDTFQHPGHLYDTFEDYSQQTILELGIQSLLLSPEWGDRLIESSGYDLTDLTRWINGHLTPNSFEMSGLYGAMSLDVTRVRHVVRNVAGLVEGREEGVIVVGAHYDHLGLGGKSSLASEPFGQIHNGADDNASGVAGLLELAAAFSREQPGKSILFLAFAGEELGLLGSRHYVENPLLPLEETIAMLNLDMIGRSNGELLVGGVGTAEEFRPILEDLDRRSPLRLSLAETASGPSDHISFALKRIPVLFFFSGLHGDYHKPSDDWEKVDLERTRQVVQVAYGLLERLVELPLPLHYVDLGAGYSVEEVPPGSIVQDRAYFGSIPDLGFEGRGLKFAQVREGSPAEMAGIRDGDVLIEMAGRNIDNLYDFTYTLRQFRPGDEVDVTVRRNGRRLRFSLILGVWPY